MSSPTTCSVSLRRLFVEESVNGFMLFTCSIPAAFGVGLLWDFRDFHSDFPGAHSELMWALGMYVAISAGHYGLIFKRNMRYHPVIERMRSTGRMKVLLAATSNTISAFLVKMSLGMFAALAIMCCVAECFRGSAYFIVVNDVFLASLPVGTYACVVAGRRLRIALWKALSSE